MNTFKRRCVPMMMHHFLRQSVPFLAATTLMLFLYRSIQDTSRSSKETSFKFKTAFYSSVKHEGVNPEPRSLSLSLPTSNPTINPDKIRAISEALNDSRAVPPAFYDGVHPWRYVMNNPDICRSIHDPQQDKDNQVVDIIIIVHTAPKHLEKRQRIRQTYANSTKFLPFFHVRIAFLLGLTTDVTLGQQLRAEHTTFRDTIMGDFVDDYHNLTFKGVMGYRWVSEFCANSRFVLKIDDDVMVDMYKLLNKFRMYMYDKKKSIFCMTKPNNTADIFRKGKWRVDSNIFYNKVTFPYDYCSGFVVLFTSDMMRPMYEAAKLVPSFWIDDLYLFGMLPYAVGGVTFHNYRRFISFDGKLLGKTALNCTKTLGDSCPIIASLVEPGEFMKHWKIIERLHSTDYLKVGIKFVQ